MFAVFNVAFPIFALIFIGYFCRKREILGGNAATEINRYVVYLALPALLFNATFNLKPADLHQPGYVAVYLIAMVVVLVFLMGVRLWQKVEFVDAAIEAMGAAYANIGFMGIPLCLLAFGEVSMGPAAIGTVMMAGLLFAISIILIEIRLNAGGHLGLILFKVLKSLMRNPLVVSPLAGIILSLSSTELPKSLLQLFTLLGNSAGPCALVALGLFLAQTSTNQTAVQGRSAVFSVVLKLFVHPALTAWLAYWVFDLPTMLADTAFLLSALPIGTGPFMLAEKYGRGAVIASRAILYSTVGSLVTVTGILVWIMQR
jgi:malonate transporter